MYFENTLIIRMIMIDRNLEYFCNKIYTFEFKKFLYLFLKLNFFYGSRILKYTSS